MKKTQIYHKKEMKHICMDILTMLFMSAGENV